MQFSLSATDSIQCICYRIAAREGYLFGPGVLISSTHIHRPEFLQVSNQGSCAEMVNAVSLELDLKVPAEKVWKAIKESRHLFPKLFPSQYKSIELIEGDGYVVGSVRLIKYGQGLHGLTFAKEKILFLDETKKTVTYEVLEGEILHMYKVFRPTFKVSEGADVNSSVVMWHVEFEPASDDVPPADFVKEAAILFKTLEGYLLSAK